MEDMGITQLYTFEEHLQDVETKFWKRFKAYKNWKEITNKQFRKKGYIETKLGFRYSGYLTFNEICNLPIQGTAFHILLWTLLKTLKRKEEEGWQTDILGHIHDAMVFDFVPEEVDHIIKAVTQIGTVDIRKEFKWINIPLEIEAELAPIDTSWYDVKEYKLAA
jgi:DNA polymerase I-like protein with 3'-5' exonuclease and polymerase domains